MRIQVVAIGHRMPGWVDSGWGEFAKRMPRECALTLTELAPARRPKSGGGVREIEEEGKRMLAAIPDGSHVVALEVEGGAWSTPKLSQRLDRWLQGGRDRGCDQSQAESGDDEGSHDYLMPRISGERRVMTRFSLTSVWQARTGISLFCSVSK